MTPIEKNIIVVDENGNKLNSTYAKRAKGLVRHGRARWLDENTICLACPPDTLDSEDMNMENADMEIIEVVKAKEEQKKDGPQGVTAAGILERIDRITEQGERLAEVVHEIHDLPVNDSPMGGNDGAERAKAIGSIYAAREKTNQKAIELLSRMYDDIAPRGPVGHDRRLEILDQIRQMSFDAVHPETARELLNFFERQLLNN